MDQPPGGGAARTASRYDSPLAAVVLAALLLGVLLGVRLVAAGGPSGMVVADSHFTHPDRPADLAVVDPGTTGYDGQFVYRLSLDPFTRTATAYGITLDNPPYRQQRIGLPLVVHAVTTATPLPTSVALVVVNVLALLAAAWAAAVLAQRLGRHALLGLVVALSPAILIGFTRDLTEPLTMALLLAGLVAWTGRRPALATLAFTAAVLTRETALAVLAGLGLWQLYAAARGPGRADAARRAAYLLVPLATYAAWQVHLRGVWGELPIAATDGDVGTPVVQTVANLLTTGTGPRALEVAWLVERLLLAALLVYAGFALRRSDAHAALRTAWVFAAGLALTTTWYTDVAFLRAANEAIVVSLLVVLGLRGRPSAVALTGAAGVSCFAAAVYGAVL